LNVPLLVALVLLLVVLLLVLPPALESLLQLLALVLVRVLATSQLLHCQHAVQLGIQGAAVTGGFGAHSAVTPVQLLFWPNISAYAQPVSCALLEIRATHNRAFFLWASA
jgi:hypothetical protein